MLLNMGQTQLATKIDEDVKDAVETVCKERGLKMNRFIEDALVDKLEELEDLEDIKTLRKEPTRPLSEVLKDLKASGKI